MEELEKRITTDAKGHKITALRGYYALIELELSKIINKFTNNPKQLTNEKL